MKPICMLGLNLIDVWTRIVGALKCCGCICAPEFRPRNAKAEKVKLALIARPKPELKPNNLSLFVASASERVLK